MARINQAMEDLMRYDAALLESQRSGFDKSHSHLTTLDSGYLIPIMCDRVVPGDEKKIRYSGLARMATPIHPTMDEARLDTFCFYIPDRLWWDNAKAFYGENLDADFNPDGEYVMPHVSPDTYALKTTEVHSLKDYLGLPFMDYVSDFPDHKCDISVGKFRCYQIVWNEYFRNSSIQPAVRISTGDDGSSQWSEIVKLRKVTKYPDQFTSLLKEPQSGDDVLLPLGEWAPVVTTPDKHTTQGSGVAMNFVRSGQTDIPMAETLLGVNGGYNLVSVEGYTAEPTAANLLTPSNLWADLTNATASTINNLRSAITVQHLLEVDAIAGKRYQQILKAHFSVFTPDATLQRPQLLGMTRTSIGMRQVIQTSSSDNVSPQGNTAAVSVTNVSNEWICNTAFTEPGYLMVLCCVRPMHSYSQGLDPMDLKLNRYDHYWPVFDRLGNQPVYLKEVFSTSADINIPGIEQEVISMDGRDPDEVFGYKPAWQEYRIMPNRVSGLMRPDAPLSLASWNYSTLFMEPPILNSNFVEEDPELINRTLAGNGETYQPQFILDSYFDYKDYKNMSVNSVPGLLRL